MNIDRRVKILGFDFRFDGNDPELTPTQKLKRKPVHS